MEEGRDAMSDVEKLVEDWLETTLSGSRAVLQKAGKDIADDTKEKLKTIGGVMKDQKLAQIRAKIEGNDEAAKACSRTIRQLDAQIKIALGEGAWELADATEGELMGFINGALDLFSRLRP
jgi:hypothetical protein